ncbi:MAG: methyltransferase domain-containing protein, partial [Actinobacteria bacterium]|nr:methyltransferase domain-containing protein [Actinomycetota bacterium]
MTDHNGPPLDDHQYTVSGLAAYESVYGTDFVSPGGERTTREILATLDLTDQTSVLDVGCGLGGAAFMMAREFGSSVVAIDLSQNMATEAAIRAENYELDQLVDVVHADIMTLDGHETFDVIHSREVFLHIRDKAALHHQLMSMLTPGGVLMFTDYCRGPQAPSESFAAYMTDFGYNLCPVDHIGQLLVDTGYEQVEATDRTDEFIAIHQRELEELSTVDLAGPKIAELKEGWQAKIERAESGEQRWGWFRAVKPH